MRISLKRTAVLTLAATSASLTLWAGLAGAATLRAPGAELGSVAPVPTDPTRGVRYFVERTVSDAGSRALGLIGGISPPPAPAPGVIPDPTQSGALEEFLLNPVYAAQYEAEYTVGDAGSRALGLIGGISPPPAPAPGVIPDPSKLLGREVGSPGGSPGEIVGGTVYRLTGYGSPADRAKELVAVYLGRRP